ncbi:MAG: ribonuclease HII [Trueperaceae bacterium]|nr:ribonuclease HII [Trueperaceae bacterium]
MPRPKARGGQSALKNTPTTGWQLEERLWRLGCVRVAGVDEAGRGALAGPVVAAVVLLDSGTPAALHSYPYRDSKVLSAAARGKLAEQIRRDAAGFAVGRAECTEIDELNVLAATKLAVRRALENLPGGFDALVTDYLPMGLQVPEVVEARADALSYQVAAASILAKVERDALMLRLEDELPGYGFARHKGYGVPEHLRALAELGPSRQHRLTFAPVLRQPLLM